MIDCHSHLADKEFNQDISDVVERAKNQGVQAAVVVTEFFSDFERVSKLTELFKDFIFPCFGIHPVQVKLFTFVKDFFKNFESANLETHFEGVEESIQTHHKKLHGIGEIGNFQIKKFYN